MRIPRITALRLMAVAAAVLLVYGGVQYWGARRQYQRQADEHAFNEAFALGLAANLTGKRRVSATWTFDVALPDGSLVRFVGPDRRPHYPANAAEPADAATVRRLVKICLTEANREGLRRRACERRADTPWPADELASN